MQDPDAPQWDSGLVLLNDGYLFQLSSAISPEPVNGENESLADFTARQRVARTARINLLANTARRTADTQKAYEDNRPPPPPLVVRPSPDSLPLTLWLMQNGLKNKCCSNV